MAAAPSATLIGPAVARNTSSSCTAAAPSPAIARSRSSASCKNCKRSIICRKSKGLFSIEMLYRSGVVGSWYDFRCGGRVFWEMLPASKALPRRLKFVVLGEFGGQYEDNFADVDKHLVDYFTFKAIRTVMAQLHEMNPTQYAWLYNFVVDHKPNDSKQFLRVLVKEKQELGERVMVTRLHLFNKWIKGYNHANLYETISTQNLELLRERLIQTIKMPSDGEEYGSNS